MTVIHCTVCGEIIPSAPKGAITTGYGLDAVTGSPVCYGCCAKRDMEDMRSSGRATLYLHMTPVRIKRGWKMLDGIKISNWPGSLEFKVLNDTAKISQTNWGLTRVDVWFEFDKFVWHGKLIGDNTQLLHCRKTAKRAQPQPTRHYVGGAGLHGYMFNYQTWGYTKGAIAEDLGSIHELSGRAIARLRRDQYFELDLHIHGNEYCEFSECDCGDPNLHSDW